jgi:N-acetylglutamate synthase-like GNAT family acetyltransferase
MHTERLPECEVTLLEARIADLELLRDAARLVADEWGGNLEDRITAMLENHSHAYILVDSSASTQRPIAVGHAVLKTGASKRNSDLIGSSVRNGILLSVVIDRNRRRLGLGRELMKLIEVVARNVHGYAYLYLWTSDAALFYEKIGYCNCEPTSIDVPAFQKQAINVQKFEDLFVKRLSQLTLDSSLSVSTSSSPYMSGNISIACRWLRKRLTFSSPIEYVSLPEAKDLIMSEFKLLRVERPSLPYLEFTLFQNSLFLCKQIGPSCGIAALAMLLAYLSTQIESGSPRNYSEWLLREAIRRGISNDGEIFSVTDLSQLASDCADQADSVLRNRLKVYVNDTASALSSVMGARPVSEPLRSTEQYIILPYDRDLTRRNGPGLQGGLHAHYALVIGSAWPLPEGSLESESKYTTTTAHFKQGHLEQAKLEQYLICVHGMSQHPVVAPVAEWIDSNAQLIQSRTGGSADLWKVDKKAGPQLAGKCLLVTFLVST